MMIPSCLPTNPIVKLAYRCLESICNKKKLVITIIIRGGGGGGGGIEIIEKKKKREKKKKEYGLKRKVRMMMVERIKRVEMKILMQKI